MSSSPYRAARRLATLLVVALATSLGCSKPKEFQPVTVFAAASTSEALDEIAAEFESRSGSTVKSNYAGSSTLAQQIEQGAPADVFLSASERWAEYLGEAGVVDQRHDLLSNRLVVITPVDSKVEIKRLDDLEEKAVEHLSLADESVPAGDYARQALKKAGVWERVEAKVVGAADVREALALVERNEAQAGIVYVTDTLVSSRVRVVMNLDAELHEPIRYPLVLLKHAESNPAAQKFYERLQSPEAAAIFKQRGFIVLP